MVFGEDETKFKAKLNTGRGQVNRTQAHQNRRTRQEITKNNNELCEQKCAKLDRYIGGTTLSETRRPIGNLQENKTAKYLIDEQIGYYRRLYTQIERQLQPEFFGVVE